jgi:hypothetical protein
MAACAWNFRKWLVIATIFLFWQKLGLFFVKYLRFFAARVSPCESRTLLGFNFGYFLAFTVLDLQSFSFTKLLTICLVKFQKYHKIPQYSMNAGVFFYLVY